MLKTIKGIHVYGKLWIIKNVESGYLYEEEDKEGGWEWDGARGGGVAVFDKQHLHDQIQLPVVLN